MNTCLYEIPDARVVYMLLQMAGRAKMVPCVCLGLLGVLCWVWVSFASFPDEQLSLGAMDAVERAAFQPQSALSEMEFASISSYRGPGNLDHRSNRELPILLWWSAGLFPHFPGDTERIDCARSSCLATSNRKVPDTLSIVGVLNNPDVNVVTPTLIPKGATLQTDSLHHFLWDRLQGIRSSSPSSPPPDLGVVS